MIFTHVFNMAPRPFVELLLSPVVFLLRIHAIHIMLCAKMNNFNAKLCIYTCINYCAQNLILIVDKYNVEYRSQNEWKKYKAFKWHVPVTDLSELLTVFRYQLILLHQWLEGIPPAQPRKQHGERRLYIERLPSLWAAGRKRGRWT